MAGGDGFVGNSADCGKPLGCEGEGWMMVELLFLPSVYAPCPTRQGARYNAKTLEIKYRDKTIADVLGW